MSVLGVVVYEVFEEHHVFAVLVAHGQILDLDEIAGVEALEMESLFVELGNRDESPGNDSSVFDDLFD